MSLSSLSLIFVGFFAVACGGQKPELVGDWVSQVFIDYQEASEKGTDFTLTLREDGTFTGLISVRVMMVLDSKLKGSYKVEGDTLALTGTNEMFRDDGYRQDTTTVPFAMKLKIEKDRLIPIQGDDSMQIVFRKKGTPPLKPPPKPKPKPSDPEALALIKEVEAVYAKLRTYSDSGTITSSGEGFKAKSGRFRMRFARDGRFLFHAEYVGEGKVYQSDAVWADGKKSWLYDGGVGGHEERPIGNGLSILSVKCGSASVLVPSLIMSDKMNGSDLARLQSVTVLPDEKIDGRMCKVIESVNDVRWTMKLWIDAESKLIRKTYESFTKMTATYHPKVDLDIPSAEFKFVPPK